MCRKPATRTIDDLLAIMAALRTPGTGCPWDLEQTFKTIAPYTIEESYEVADAIARGDKEALREELGDLLLQVVYHARMAEEEGSFDFAGVVNSICEKMVRRHPHVFGDPAMRSDVELDGLWERVKAEERASRGGDAGRGLLDGVPVALPGLTRAVKLQARAAKAGFDWPNTSGVMQKVREESEELAQEIDGGGDSQRLSEELGDLLFVVANLGRKLTIDPESAIRSANAKFERRFAEIERRLKKDGRRPDDCSLQELDSLWEAVKAAERTE